MEQYYPKWPKNKKLENGLTYQYFSEVFYHDSVDPKKDTNKLADLINF